MAGQWTKLSNKSVPKTTVGDLPFFCYFLSRFTGTFCGVFRRQALDRGAAALGVDHIITGHNADDMAETILMNILRGDIARLERCTDICTRGPENNPDDQDQAAGCGNHDAAEFGGTGMRRSKPFKYSYEKEIVM